MPRAPPGLSLLLMAGLAIAATPPLEIVNPWLSACDLQPNSAADLQGACSAMWSPGLLCPPPCPANSTTQCLHYLQNSHKEEVCGLGYDPGRRRDRLKKLRMRHCCEHAVAFSLPEDVFQGGETCRNLLDALLEVDALAARISCEFAEVLTRYDCGQIYSIAHRCDNCKDAYRRWVCSSLVPHFKWAGERVEGRMRPCLGVCQNVEQQCPYMLPGDRAPAQPTQYAGEPTFHCLDANIPLMGEQKRKSSRGDKDCCYTHCDPLDRGVCEHCPGRPSNDTAEPLHCSSDNTSKVSGCRPGVHTGAHSGAPGAPRTLNKVFLLWTAWILLLKTTYNLLQCLLVMCATRVRTSPTWIKTKWRSCS